MHTKTELENMKAKEVRSVAQGLKVPQYWTRKKTDLIESILEAEARQSTNDKMNRIKRAEEGLFVAYRYNSHGTERTYTAKIIENNPESKTLCVETKLGSKFTISYEQVIWVKTKRWPKGVLEEIKRGN